ncbi:hypothetical protein GGI42DRAFT_337851 [Trichoderma sp. SZMC 28013]
MAIHISPTSTEIEASVKETIHSLLQRYPDHNRGSVLSEVLRHSFQTITIEFGKTLPKELRWCEKLPTIVLLDESISAENQLMAEPTTQNDTITTQDKPITERCSTPNDTTYDSASATQDTSNPESLPKPDNTAQDSTSAAQDTSSPERNSTSDNASSTPEPSLMVDAIIQELMAQAENLKAWTKDPSLFWNHSTQSPAPPERTLLEQRRSLCEVAAEECLNAMIRTATRRYRSIIVYLLFKQLVDLERTNSNSEKTNSNSEKKKVQYITKTAIHIFLTSLGLPADKEKKEKYSTLLHYGQRCLEFCHHLSKRNERFEDFSRNSVNFEDIKYGFLYLSLDERMWDKKQIAYRHIYDKTVRDLNVQKLLDAVETSGANLAAKTILQHCQALVQEQPALSNGKDINYTSTLNQSEAENTFQEPRAPADESNGTVASKRSSTEAGLDDPTASKRSRQNMDILAEAVMCQSATVFETVITNDSNRQTVQPNNAPSLNHTPFSNSTSCPNSEIDQNLVDTQDGNLGNMNVTSEEPQQQEVADLCTSNWETEQYVYLNMVDWDSYGEGFDFRNEMDDMLQGSPLPNVGSLSIDRTDTLQASS